MNVNAIFLKYKKKKGAAGDSFFNDKLFCSKLSVGVRHLDDASGKQDVRIRRAPETLFALIGKIDARTFLRCCIRLPLPPGNDDVVENLHSPFVEVERLLSHISHLPQGCR